MAGQNDFRSGEDFMKDAASQAIKSRDEIRQQITYKKQFYCLMLDTKLMES